MTDSGLNREITITVSSKHRRVGKTYVSELIRSVLEKNGYDVVMSNVKEKFDVRIREVPIASGVVASEYDSITMVNRGGKWTATGIRRDTKGVCMISLTPTTVFAILMDRDGHE